MENAFGWSFAPMESVGGNGSASLSQLPIRSTLSSDLGLFHSVPIGGTQAYGMGAGVISHFPSGVVGIRNCIIDSETGIGYSSPGSSRTCFWSLELPGGALLVFQYQRYGCLVALGDLVPHPGFETEGKHIYFRKTFFDAGNLPGDATPGRSCSNHLVHSFTHRSVGSFLDGKSPIGYKCILLHFSDCS